MSLFDCLLGGSSQSSLKMRIKLGKQSVEKAKIEMGAVVSSNISLSFILCVLFVSWLKKNATKFYFVFCGDDTNGTDWH